MATLGGFAKLLDFSLTHMLPAYWRKLLDGTDLTETDIRGANLQIAKNLTQEQIESAFGSSGGYEYMPDTILPDHLTAPESWNLLLSQQIKERGY
jgi:hypothetical protein